MIPLFRPNLPSVETIGRIWDSSLRSGLLTNYGPCSEMAQDMLANRFGGYWLPVSNGTVALEIALMSLKRGSRVAVPDFTFAATILAVIRAGHIPVMIGCRSCDMSVSSMVHNLEKNQKKYDAILGVSNFGYGYEWRLNTLGKPVIWDFAGAFPMIVNHKICCYSLHAAKSMPIGEGGLIRFPFLEQYEEAKRLASFSFDKNRACSDDRGMNGKLDDLHCAILIGQLNRFESIKEEILSRKRLTLRYQRELIGVCNPFMSVAIDSPSLCVLRGLDAEKVVEAGKKNGIVFRRYYYPFLSEMPAFKNYEFIGDRSDASLKTLVAFPSSVTDEEFNTVVASVKSAC